jgi:hypothetical protein
VEVIAIDEACIARSPAEMLLLPLAATVIFVPVHERTGEATFSMEEIDTCIVADETVCVPEADVEISKEL